MTDEFKVPFGPDEVTLVDSSNIYGFVNTDPDLVQKRADLYVIFRGGDLWVYDDVESGDIEAFVGADSVGRAFHSRIRQYGGVKLGNIFEGDDGKEEG